MKPVEPGAAEQARLAALRRLGALDQPRRSDLDTIARLAAHVCGAPTSTLTLIDEDRQWAAAAHGWRAVDIPRCDALCDVSIASHDVTHTADAGADPRWANNPLADGRIASVRFYASAPLIVSTGEIVGSLCVFSEEVIHLERVQVERLRDLAGLAVELLELHTEAAQLGAAALRDPLTGLPNRTLLIESLHQSLGRAQRGQAAPVVVFLDVNGFKLVNDTYGHAAGDALLCAVAERLVATVRVSDLVARLGGDEFVLVCDGSDNPGVVAGRIRAAFTEPMSMFIGKQHTDIALGVSLGAVEARAGESADDVLLRADASMYRDKHATRTDRRAGHGPRAALHPRTPIAN